MILNAAGLFFAMLAAFACSVTFENECSDYGWTLKAKAFFALFVFNCLAIPFWLFRIFS